MLDVDTIVHGAAAFVYRRYNHVYPWADCLSDAGFGAVKALTRLDPTLSEAEAATYIRTRAVGQGMDKATTYYKYYRRTEALSGAPRLGPANQSNAKRDIARLLKLAYLTKLQLYIIHLYYVEELSFIEIAPRIGKSASTACQLHQKALAKIRAYLKKREEVRKSPLYSQLRAGPY